MIRWSFLAQPAEPELGTSSLSKVCDQFEQVPKPTVSMKPRCVGPRVLRNVGWIPTAHDSVRREIEVRQPQVTHSIVIARLEAWMDAHAIDPEDSAQKQKLRELLYWESPAVRPR
jgi:hypothetical protein